MNPTWRIVFVDDEQAMLDSLRNVLRKERSRWTMTFHSSAKVALETMTAEVPDVVVSDMRMPGMDGAEFLTEVKRRFPGTARLVLSGHAERAAIVRALPVAHQFLDKPCDTTALRTAVERTCRLQRLLGGEEVRKVVGAITTLPTVPSLYQKLLAVIGDPKASLSDVAKVIEQDPAMSGKVLQLVNSSFFGAAQRITTVSRAASYLGLELIKGLVLTAGVFGNPATAHQAVLDEVQNDALRTARLTRKLLAGDPCVEEATTSALLHDVGKLVIAAAAPDLFTRWQAAYAGGRGPLEHEKEIYGATHAEIGAYLLGVWGLPFSIVEAVAYHHEPSKVEAGERTMLAGVHAAAALVEDPNAPLDEAFLESAGVSDRIEQWRALAGQTA